jgi:hypothetical protein
MNDWWIAAPNSDSAQLVDGRGFDFDGHISIVGESLIIRRRDDDEDDVQIVPVKLVAALLASHGVIAE